MLQKPRNYEEAKRIIINSVTDDYVNHHFKVIKLRAAFITAIGVAAGIVTGLITGNPTWTSGIIPLSGLLGISGLLPILGRNITTNSIEKGTYFNNLSKQEVMELATKYVKEYNEFEKKKEGKSR